MTFASAPGGRIHYRVDGPPGAPVVVLSHSLGADLGMWEPQVPALAERFRVLRYDARGHGGSDPVPGPWGTAHLARDVIGLLDQVGVARASFCGLSMGGLVGVRLALQAPDRLERLVLCNTAARIGTAESWNARVQAVQRGGMAAVAEAVVARWVSEPFAAAHPGQVARLRAMLLRTPPEGYAAGCRAVRDADERESASAVRAPTLVIAGSRDAATPPADGRLLADRIPGARSLELEAAHLSNVEAARPFTQAVLAFLGG